MAYDTNKDKVLKVSTHEYEGGSLLFALISYDGGPPKLQISRTYDKRNGETGYGKLGRMTIREVQFFIDNGKEIIENMKAEAFVQQIGEASEI